MFVAAQLGVAGTGRLFPDPVPALFLLISLVYPQQTGVVTGYATAPSGADHKGVLRAH